MGGFRIIPSLIIFKDFLPQTAENFCDFIVFISQLCSSPCGRIVLSATANEDHWEVVIAPKLLDCCEEGDCLFITKALLTKITFEQYAKRRFSVLFYLFIIKNL